MRKVFFDLETLDPTLKDTGTDAHTRKAGGKIFLCGLMLPEDNVISTHQELYVSLSDVSVFLNEGCEWFGANLKYDLNWLLSEGILKPEHTHNNVFRDVLIDAALIDETQDPSFYSLDGQCKHYNLPTKPVDELLAAAARVGIKCTEKTVRGKLYEIFSAGEETVIREYLKHDLVATWEVAQRQAPLIVENKLERIRELESKLIPILSMMENRGVKVDLVQAQRLTDECQTFIDGVAEKLKNANNGIDVPLNRSNAQIDFLIGRGHKLPETKKSTPDKPLYSASAVILEQCAKVDPLIQDLLDAKRAEKIGSKFANDAIIKYSHNGRIHPNINQIVGYDEGEGESKGVRFGRLSYSNPNLQQIPKKDKVSLEGLGGLGSAMRRVFCAEDGAQIMSADFSSQEPRLMIHFAEIWEKAVGEKTGKRSPWGAERIGDMYRKDARVSSHDIVAQGIEADIPYKKKRDAAKVINLGTGYEMGMSKLIAGLVEAGIDPAQADTIMENFRREFPHVQMTSWAARDAADQNGYVRTYYGRKLHFKLFEPVMSYKQKQNFNYLPPLPYDEAWEKYTVQGVKGKEGINYRFPLQRHKTYRALNRVIQGSAADQTKAAMVSLWYDHGILPYLQIHDELVDATIKDIRTVAIYKQVMENVMPLTIPSLTDVKLGKNWKEAILTHLSPEFSSLRRDDHAKGIEIQDRQ